MSRIDQVRESVAVHLSDIRELLAMRLLFQPVQPVVTIEQEIYDLYVYPERLESSYRDEWHAIAVKAIYQNAFLDQQRTDEDNLNGYFTHLRDQAMPECRREHERLFQALEEVRAIAHAGNTVPFPDPRRQALMHLIWPKY